MQRKTLNRLVEEYKRHLDYNYKVRIRLRSYKLKAASANIEKQTIILNRELLGLGDDVIKYLILHELIHLKLRTTYHNGDFTQLLYEHMPKDIIDAAREKIIKKLLELNGDKLVNID